MFDSVKDLIEVILQTAGIPCSIAVDVAKDGQIRWEEGFGWANWDGRIKASPYTLYSLASITKPITATAIMLLHQQGRLDLDRPINDYLGAARVNARGWDERECTIRRILNHTSGLPLHYHFFYADEPYTRPPMDETIHRYANLVRAPGERYCYSNLGYGILDYVISRVSAKSYADFMQEELFQPLGMPHASVDIAPGLAKFAAERYGSDSVPYPFYVTDQPGGSAVFCSAHGLARFGMFHLKERLPVRPDR